MREPKTVADFDRAIAEMQEKREKAARDEAIFKALPLNKRVAIVLHGNHCHANHTDGCGWFYEIPRSGEHDFNGSTHRHWLSRADSTIKNLKLAAPNLTDDEKLAVIEAVSAPNY